MSDIKKHGEEGLKDRSRKPIHNPLYVKPRKPRLNGKVERSHREEFYEVEEISLSLEEHNRQFENWEYTYNYIRPHQSLDYLTPNEYY
jgi:transposase InsO family protein